MIVQRATGRHGGEYRYYFCRGVQSHICDAPYSDLELVEAAAEDHYESIHFHPDFITSLRRAMKETLHDSTNVSRLLRADITKQLKSLDVKEDNLLDLAASGSLAKDKINQRLRDIERQRAKFTGQLNDLWTTCRAPNSSSMSVSACSKTPPRCTGVPVTRRDVASIRRFHSPVCRQRKGDRFGRYLAAGRTPRG